ncbi:hypothetical protein HL42_7086 [Trichophyton rubrum]|nr:hypothetical protein HL42_7086 [Trichophyton rubrum]
MVRREKAEVGGGSRLCVQRSPIPQQTQRRKRLSGEGGRSSRQGQDGECEVEVKVEVEAEEVEEEEERDKNELDEDELVEVEVEVEGEEEVEEEEEGIVVLARNRRFDDFHEIPKKTKEAARYPTNQLGNDSKFMERAQRPFESPGMGILDVSEALKSDKMV